MKIGCVLALVALLFLEVASGVSAPVSDGKPPRPAPLIDESKLVDLTYDFDSSTIYWPTAQSFHWEKEAWGRTASGQWYAAGRYAASEHGGTHMDSPIHFAEGKRTLDELPLAQLVGPAVVIDISAACAKDADYELSVEDVASWERQHGRIAAGTIVLVRTGWGKFWPDRKDYLGDDTAGDDSHLHFPGIGREAAELLVSRHIDGVGIDTAGVDSGASTKAFAHQALCAADIYGLENVAHLERLPAQGAMLIALPMKIKGGSGGPVRIIAILP